MQFLERVVQPGRRKPRVTGLTMVLDRLANPPELLTGALAEYVDVVKLGWGIPLLMDQEAVRRRVARYRHAGIHVSNGGTLLEIAVSRGRHRDALRGLLDHGFDTVELSEGVIDIPRRAQEEIVEFVRSHGMRLHWEVGRKNPHNQLSLDESVDRIEAARRFRPDLVIIEGRESGKAVEIFDETGAIKWDWVERLRDASVPLPVMFEAPIEIQQTELVIRLGPDVNLGNVAMTSVAALESQRQGWRGDTFGVPPATSDVELSPAARFVHYVLRAHGALDQPHLVQLTGLNRRTVQHSLRSLTENELVWESRDPHDYRRRQYSCAAIRPGASRRPPG
jgi:phosphosulfolactate synthase